MTERTAAIALRAQIFASSAASSALTAPPTFPVAANAPLIMGSCPEV
ncbi:unannotated protein [freshwater metagenome]|uniref:Unannotated protein n=1 Tax=freshwater metagenome TaxID=449393 RepID=A0A6J6U730_9ZZZZ